MIDLLPGMQALHVFARYADWRQDAPGVRWAPCARCGVYSQSVKVLLPNGGHRWQQPPTHECGEDFFHTPERSR